MEVPRATENVAYGDGPSTAEVTGTTGDAIEGVGPSLAALSPTTDCAVEGDETSSRPMVGVTEGAVVGGAIAEQGEVPLVGVESDGSRLGVEEGDTILNGVTAKRRVNIKTCTNRPDVADHLFVQGAIITKIEIGRIRPQVLDKYELIYG